MGQIMLNGNAYAGGMGSGCGCFIDTSNVIVPTTSVSPLSYTATQDCAVVISAEMSGGSYIHVFIDNTTVCSYVSNEDATFCQTFFVRRGQNIGTTQFVSVTYNISYTVYGVIQGLDSMTQSRYSTSEKAVGTWIDGSIIYEKTIYSHNINISENAKTAIEASFVGNKIISYSGYDLSGTTIYALPDGRIRLMLEGGDLKLQSINGGTWSGDIWVTVRYTKSST